MVLCSAETDAKAEQEADVPSHLGGHAGVEGVLVLRRAHLLPPHHLLQAHVVVVLEVAHALAVDVRLDLPARVTSLNTRLHLKVDELRRRAEVRRVSEAST